MDKINLNVFTNKYNYTQKQFEDSILNKYPCFNLKQIIEFKKGVSDLIQKGEIDELNGEEVDLLNKSLEDIKALTKKIVKLDSGATRTIFVNFNIDLEKGGIEIPGTEDMPDGTIQDYKNAKFIKKNGEWIPYDENQQNNNNQNQNQNNNGNDNENNNDPNGVIKQGEAKSNHQHASETTNDDLKAFIADKNSDPGLVTIAKLELIGRGEQVDGNNQNNISNNNQNNNDNQDPNQQTFNNQNTEESQKDKDNILDWFNNITDEEKQEIYAKVKENLEGEENNEENNNGLKNDNELENKEEEEQDDTKKSDNSEEEKTEKIDNEKEENEKDHLMEVDKTLNKDKEEETEETEDNKEKEKPENKEEVKVDKKKKKEDNLEKGIGPNIPGTGGEPEGTIKDWQGGKFKKTNGKWLPYNSNFQQNNQNQNNNQNNNQQKPDSKINKQNNKPEFFNDEAKNIIENFKKENPNFDLEDEGNAEGLEELYSEVMDVMGYDEDKKERLIGSRKEMKIFENIDKILKPDSNNQNQQHPQHEENKQKMIEHLTQVEKEKKGLENNNQNNQEKHDFSFVPDVLEQMMIESLDDLKTKDTGKGGVIDTIFYNVLDDEKKTKEFEPTPEEAKKYEYIRDEVIKYVENLLKNKENNKEND